MDRRERRELLASIENLTHDDEGLTAALGRKAAGKRVVLKTQAETTYPGHGTSYYDVALVEDPRYYEKYGLSLDIEGTPGKWLLETLWEREHPMVAIDGGAHWDWVNTHDVYQEVKKLVRRRRGYGFK